MKAEKRLTLPATLAGLMQGVDARVVYGDPARTKVGEISVDSRSAGRNSVFVAWQGVQVDSHQFIPQVVASGVAAVVCRAWPAGLDPAGATVIETANPRAALALMAASFWGRPADRLSIVGVTGTDGKSTTCMIMESIFRAAGHRTGLVGTIEYRIHDEAVPSVQTTPEPLLLHQLFARMTADDVSHVAMEVSSQGLDQARVHGIDFAAAILTNVTRDHIDAHGSLENYVRAKCRLFSGLRPAAPAVLNRRDSHFETFRAASTGRVVTYGLDMTGCDVGAVVMAMDLGGMTLRLVTPDWTAEVRTSLIGRFNAENILGAAAAAWALGVDAGSILAGIEAARRPAGRLEPVTVAGVGGLPVCLVDYAHTPHAMETVLSTVRPLVPGRVISVFGAGGNRDSGKRAAMGECATRLSDHVIVTADNSRYENTSEIIRQILSGVPVDRRNVETLYDRRRAIARALDLAFGPCDLVLIMGKGHESGQIEGGVVLPFDDRLVARELLQRWSDQRRCVA